MEHQKSDAHRSLVPRIEPQQDRAKATVANILDTAAVFIQREGIESFNTNLLAEKCGVRVRSIYRYFPNKHAVIAALYESMAAEWRPLFVEGFVRMANPAFDWRLECATLGREFLGALQRMDGAIAIRRAMKTEPSLVAFERADNAELAEEFATLSAARIPGLSQSELERVGRTWMNAASLLVDIALDCGPKERALQHDETLALQVSYLANYFD